MNSIYLYCVVPTDLTALHSYSDVCCTIFNLQYGFVNSALEKLIKRRFGVEKWEEIR